MRRIATAMLFALLLPIVSWATDFPELTTFVNDNAGVFKPEDKEAMSPFSRPRIASSSKSSTVLYGPFFYYYASDPLINSRVCLY